MLGCLEYPYLGVNLFHLVFTGVLILGDPGAVSWFQVRAEEPPWGHCLTILVPNGRSRSGIWLVPENLCVFLSNQSEVCFRVLSCVLKRTCKRSSVAPLVCLGRATKLCPRWKVSVSAHNVREIDPIVRENVALNVRQGVRLNLSKFLV